MDLGHSAGQYPAFNRRLEGLSYLRAGFLFRFLFRSDDIDHAAAFLQL